MAENESNLDEEDPVDENESPESQDGFSLEALSKAYARAVAQQNLVESDLSEDGADEDGADEDGAVDDDADEDGAGEILAGEILAGETLAGEENTDANIIIMGQALADEVAEADLSSDELASDDENEGILDEEADNAPCPISPKSILESMLFVGMPDGSPMKNRNLAALMRGVSPKEVTQLTHELNQEYEAQAAPYRIKRDAGGYRMELEPAFDPVRQKFYGEVKEARLSQPAIDVLSVVAYNQPMTREQVEKIRARPSGAILLQLVRRGLLDREKTETQPRQTLFSTTSRFLELFGLDNLHDLPQTENIDLMD